MRIAAATGARLFCETFPARTERGGAHPALERLPYFPEQAVAALSAFRTLILAGARTPVAFFGYPGQPSLLVPQGCAEVVLARPDEDVRGALERLQLIFHDALRIVEQPADERGLAVVDRAAGQEAQQALVAVARQVGVFEIGLVVRPGRQQDDVRLLVALGRSQRRETILLVAEEIGKVLDAGAMGVIIPMVNSVEEARAALGELAELRREVASDAAHACADWASATVTGARLTACACAISCWRRRPTKRSAWVSRRKFWA